MAENMNLYQKLSAITAELQTVAKNLTVEVSRNARYKGVSERDVLDAVKPIEAKYRIYSYPAARRILESEMLESENEYQGRVTKRTTFFARVETVYRFVDIDKPEDFIETTVFSEGIDTQDKGSGKAMTYGDKYALMKAYKISTGDDPDQDASKEVQYRAAPSADDERRAAKSQLALLLKQKGLDVKVFAQEKGLSTETSTDELRQLIAELEAM